MQWTSGDLYLQRPLELVFDVAEISRPCKILCWMMEISVGLRKVHNVGCQNLCLTRLKAFHVLVVYSALIGWH